MEGAEPGFAAELGLNVKPGDITEVGGEAHTTILGLFYDRGTGDWGFNVREWKDEGLPFLLSSSYEADRNHVSITSKLWSLFRFA